jgi:hypothetical protein
VEALNLKPTHASIKAYYAALHQLGQLHISHEMAVRSAFPRGHECPHHMFDLGAEAPFSFGILWHG